MTTPTKKPHQAASVEEAVDLLADLDLAECEAYRKTVAEEWDLRASVLDRMVSAKRKEKAADGSDEFGWHVEPAKFEVSPLLTFSSPEMRCGKTTAMRIVMGLSPRPLPASNITAPALFRAVE